MWEYFRWPHYLKDPDLTGKVTQKCAFFPTKVQKKKVNKYTTEEGGTR